MKNVDEKNRRGVPVEKAGMLGDNELGSVAGGGSAKSPVFDPDTADKIVIKTDVPCPACGQYNVYTTSPHQNFKCFSCDYSWSV